MSKRQEKSQIKNPPGNGSRASSDELFIKKLNLLRDLKAKAAEYLDEDDRAEVERMALEDSDSRCVMELTKAVVERDKWRQSLEERTSELMDEIQEKRIAMRALVDAHISKQEKEAAERLRMQERVEKTKSENNAKVMMFRSSLRELHAQILEVLNKPRYLPAEVFSRDVERFLAI